MFRVLGVDRVIHPIFEEKKCLDAIPVCDPWSIDVLRTLAGDTEEQE